MQVSESRKMLKATIQSLKKTHLVCLRSSEEASMPQQGEYSRDEVRELIGVGIVKTLTAL